MNFLIIIALLSCLPDIRANNTIYSRVQPINLSTLEWVEEEWPNESFHDYLSRCLEYQMSPQEVKKRRIVFRMFHRVVVGDEKPHNVLADTITMQDLNLLNGQKMTDPYLAQILDRTHTEYGRVFLYALIGNPIDDAVILEKRQACVKNFVRSPELLDQLDATLSTLKAHENIMHSFWGQDGFVHSSARHYYDLPFFKKLNDKLNGSQTALELRSLMGHQKRAVFVATGVFAAVLLPLYGIYKLCGAEFPERLSNLAESLIGSGGRLLAILSNVDERHVAGGAILAAGAYSALACKEDYTWAADNFTLDSCMQKKMIGVAHFFKAVRELKRCIEENETAFSECDGARKIVEFFEEAVVEDAQLKKFFSLLDDIAAYDDSSIIAYQGKFLVAFRMMHDLKEHFEPLLHALGEVDAFVSIADLFRSFENERVGFCFVTYEKADQPHIAIRDFWNPFVDKNRVVSNSVELGGEYDRNMIITGPNAGGKSTLIKGIAINLILAQSLGIAAASEMYCTPFHSIGTYLNVVDDIAAGNSLFKAQVLRAQQMVDLVEGTPDSAFSFIALDEMFNGTSAKESKVAAYSVAKHIGQFKNNMCVIATHFPLLTQLESADAGFVNYKVSVGVNYENGINYPFTLEKGISDQHVALYILREEGYACSIVEEALALLKRKTA